MQVLEVRAQNQYAVPRVCCVCGSSAGPEVLQAQDASGGSTVSLSFPLCPPCSRVRDIGVKRSRIGLASGLGVSALLCIASLVISQVFDVTPGTTLNCLLGSLLILSAAAFLITGVFALIKGREPSYRRVREAVRIEGYKRGWTGKDTITISFANEQFADLFRQLNAAVVLGSERK